MSAMVDPVSGRVNAFDTRGNGAISAQEVRDRVLAAGYERITDIEFDDGFWEVEAINHYGHEMDLVVHPVSGEILNAPMTRAARP